MKAKTDDGYMPTHVGEKFQAKLDALKHKSDWSGLITMLKRYISRYPNEYFFYQQLAATYYIDCISKYKLAYKYAEQAYNMEPDDDLNIYTYACSLYYVGRIDEALDYFSRIISKDIEDIAYGEHGEGIRYAKQLIIDSIYMSGVICKDKHQYHEANDLFVRHLANRKRGQHSDFTRKQVLKKLAEIASEIQKLS